jgi:hypothetical protein
MRGHNKLQLNDWAAPKLSTAGGLADLTSEWSCGGRIGPGAAAY